MSKVKDKEWSWPKIRAILSSEKLPQLQSYRINRQLISSPVSVTKPHRDKEGPGGHLQSYREKYSQQLLGKNHSTLLRVGLQLGNAWALSELSYLGRPWTSQYCGNDLQLLLKEFVAAMEGGRGLHRFILCARVRMEPSDCDSLCTGDSCLGHWELFLGCWFLITVGVSHPESWHIKKQPYKSLK